MDHSFHLMPKTLKYPLRTRSFRCLILYRFWNDHPVFTTKRNNLSGRCERERGRGAGEGGGGCNYRTKLLLKTPKMQLQNATRDHFQVCTGSTSPYSHPQRNYFTRVKSIFRRLEKLWNRFVIAPHALIKRAASGEEFEFNLCCQKDYLCCMTPKITDFFNYCSSTQESTRNRIITLYPLYHDALSW